MTLSSLVVRKILKVFGYEIYYECAWGIYPYRYDSIDFMMSRPIHKDMGTAPPWAVRKFRKIE